MSANGSRRKNPPSYRLHRGTGQGVVTLNGKDFYLGLHGTPESKAKYDRAIAEWYARGRQITPPTEGHARTTVSQIVAAFMVHADGYYRGPDGQHTSELDNYRQTIRPLEKLYGQSPADEVGPLALKAVRHEMIRMGWSRRNINKQVNRIRSLFKWAASEELVPASVFESLRTVAGLQPGRGGAKETAPIRPAPDAAIEAVKPFVSRQVWALIQLQLFTGARAGELVKIRPIDIDVSRDVWTYCPIHHKTAHHGHKRTIYIGPKSQGILQPFIVGREPTAFLFSAAEAEKERRERMHAKRRTPLSCGNVPGSNRQDNPDCEPGECYEVCSYRRAIARACDQAFPPPDVAARCESLPADEKESATFVAKWRREHRWHPHQLRHNAATYIRREFGLESSKVLLGHHSLNMTQLYAEADQEKAYDVVRRIG